MLRFGAEPRRWMRVTAPVLAPKNDGQSGPLENATLLWQNLDGLFRMTNGDRFNPKAIGPDQR